MDSKRSEEYRFVSIEAQDPLISYDASWSDTTTTTGDPAKLTTASDGSATATLTFHGIAIYAFGWVGPAGPPNPSIECYVDGNLTAAPFELPGNGDDYHHWLALQLCWAEGLTDQNHTMKFIVTKASEDYPFMLDMFMFRLSRKQYQDLSGVLDATNSSTSTSTSLSATSSSTASGIPAPAAQKVSIPPIVGGVLGAVAALVVAAIGVYFLVRRRKQSYAKLFDRDALVSDTEKVTPFMESRRSSRRLSVASLALDEPEPALSVAAATFNPSAEDPEQGAGARERHDDGGMKAGTSHGDDTRASRPRRSMHKRLAASFASALQRTRGGWAGSQTMSDVPSEAPPVYSAGSGRSVDETMGRGR
ncbi:hypothetical protein OH77DRAFT_1431313 [Trametes cingulata]|nr:hypothetical protein OH77DRAFT_1431313 [Trametes cingulata]